jgi:predicted protein tyrosine phosphatase
MNVLFVCSANVDRSKTADDFFSEQFDQIRFNSGGTNHKICQQEGTNPLTQEMVDAADMIFVMEKKHQDWIYDNLNAKGKEMIVLNIEDRYTYYSIKLIELLQQKCNRYFES